MTVNELLENFWKKTGVFTFQPSPKELIERFGEDTKAKELAICKNAVGCLLERMPLHIVYLITFLFARQHLELGEKMEQVREDLEVILLKLDKE